MPIYKRRTSVLIVVLTAIIALPTMAVAGKHCWSQPKAQDNFACRQFGFQCQPGSGWWPKTECKNPNVDPYYYEYSEDHEIKCEFALSGASGCKNVVGPLKAKYWHILNQNGCGGSKTPPNWQYKGEYVVGQINRDVAITCKWKSWCYKP
jgi:hypothetical protein